MQAFNNPEHKSRSLNACFLSWNLNDLLGHKYESSANWWIFADARL